MDYCPGHSGYGEDIRGNCKFCGKPIRTSAPSSAPLSEVNPFELGRLLAKKREQERRNKIPQYSDCPRGHKRALFYNAVNDSFTCSECKYTLLAGTEEYKAIFFKIVDTEQPMKREPSPKKHDKHDLFANVIWPDDSLKSIEEQNESAMSDLSNPMLISVKMFLADIRPWVRQYREGAYVCSDFAQEVCNAAKDREMRCGYVTIGFEKSFVGHAIIAFETDYGLIFIEPQDGEQIYLSINKPYPIRLKGIPEDDNIILIEISWNDGTSTRID